MTQTFTEKLIGEVRSLESQAEVNVVELIRFIGINRLRAFIEQKTASTLLRGTTINSNGKIDFSLAEERFLKLPPAWLKLVVKFLGDLIEDLRNIRDETLAQYRGVVPMSAEAREMINSVGLEELIIKGVVTNLETTVAAKIGGNRPVMVSASALTDEAGNINGLVIVAKDLSEVQRLQREKMEILERAKEEGEKLVAERTRELEEKRALLEKALLRERAFTQQLKASEQQLKALNQQLEAAQKNLNSKISDLERFNKLVVGRELKMIELKKEIAGLKNKT